MASTRRRVLALVAAVLIVAAATATALLVRSDDEQSETTPPTSQPPVRLLPLLGTPGEVPQRAALGVKIDNTEPGRPQTGLAQADVVFEEMVEGGLPRLLAVFHSQDPESLGPVRSARSTDLFILAELGRPLFAWSGANPTFAAAVEAADLVDVGVGATPDGYRREPDRLAPYNLYAASDLLREAVADDDSASIPPPAIFSYRAAGTALAGPGVEPVTGFRTTGSGALSIEIAWEWDAASASWVRDQDGTPHVDRDGEDHALPRQRRARRCRGRRTRGGGDRRGRRVVAQRRAGPARTLAEAVTGRAHRVRRHHRRASPPDAGTGVGRGAAPGCRRRGLIRTERRPGQPLERPTSARVFTSTSAGPRTGVDHRRRSPRILVHRQLGGDLWDGVGRVAAAHGSSSTASLAAISGMASDGSPPTAARRRIRPAATSGGAVGTVADEDHDRRVGIRHRSGTDGRAHEAAPSRIRRPVTRSGT